MFSVCLRVFTLQSKDMPVWDSKSSLNVSQTDFGQWWNINDRSSSYSLVHLQMGSVGQKAKSKFRHITYSVKKNQQLYSVQRVILDEINAVEYAGYNTFPIKCLIKLKKQYLVGIFQHCCLSDVDYRYLKTCKSLIP